jgi:hypothetical protein
MCSQYRVPFPECRHRLILPCHTQESFPEHEFSNEVFWNGQTHVPLNSIREESRSEKTGNFLEISRNLESTFPFAPCLISLSPSTMDAVNDIHVGYGNRLFILPSLVPCLGNTPCSPECSGLLPTGRRQHRTRRVSVTVDCRGPSLDYSRVQLGALALQAYPLTPRVLKVTASSRRGSNYPVSGR